LESLRTQAPARSLENLSRVLGVSAILIGLVLLGFTIEGFLKE
jgi:hypothetical protein